MDCIENNMVKKPLLTNMCICYYRNLFTEPGANNRGTAGGSVFFAVET
jgi:hypothetical protein